ncbi:hypothetical protein SAMN05444266_101270 [Chitinophaga jiangningensis]|uniref:Uncharacterized protein n=1 Tax=Chitinophaga jiangningensis TaxID=1419482 RepID=A0A1M6VMI8_9BACT|nr:DUF6770 family protein [Chitinophaga jiangningensis]SHK82541.1 hypothetical protein SAMN05444266_101270 [Chitinophaga jiangningensis]
MVRKILTGVLSLYLCATTVQAQNKLSVDNVYSTYLRNSGTIMEKNQIKGYFFFYQSDKVDRKTNEYTLQILDENLNKVKDITFQDNKNVVLLESAYNGSSLSFLFKDAKERTLTMKIYSLDGKLLNTYTNEYSKKTEQFMMQYETMHSDEGTNQSVFEVGDKGYISVMPVREGKDFTYEIDLYGSEKKAYWKYIPTDDKEKFAMAEYLGSTDSLVLLQVYKKSNLFRNNFTSHFVGINFVTKRKVFDLDGENDEYLFSPTTVTKDVKTGNILVAGTYFDKKDNVVKDPSKGLAFYTLNSKGEILTRSYNSWETDMGKVLGTSSKGKIDGVGYLYIHKMIQSPDGKLHVVAEGYKRQVSAGGMALKVLGAAAGATTNAGATKIVVTDMVVMTFDQQYHIAEGKIYPKTQNTAMGSAVTDFASAHMLAMYIKAVGYFDYDFTTGDEDNENFSFCYSDYVKDADYKGQTFNTIHFDGKKYSQDKINLKSKASKSRILPAKAGSVMIIEYFKKDKRMDLRLEKIS